jgi:branched-chain amino acid transport system permease protein
MLGYDIRVRQWVVFVLAALLAALSGLLYVQWGNYITPSQVGLLSAALPVIWVAVGGREKLLAVVIGTYALNWLNYQLSSSGNQYALVIIGALLVIVMVFFPRGLVVILADLAGRRSAPSERRQLEFAGRWHDRSHPVDRRPAKRSAASSPPTMSRSTSPRRPQIIGTARAVDVRSSLRPS